MELLEKEGRGEVALGNYRDKRHILDILNIEFCWVRIGYGVVNAKWQRLLLLIQSSTHAKSINDSLRNMKTLLLQKVAPEKERLLIHSF